MTPSALAKALGLAYILLLDFKPTITETVSSPMPKLKTHKATAKRIKRRGSNTLKRKKAYGTHKLGKRATKRKRELRKNLPVAAANSVNVRRSLGMK